MSRGKDDLFKMIALKISLQQGEISQTRYNQILKKLNDERIETAKSLSDRLNVDSKALKESQIKRDSEAQYA